MRLCREGALRHVGLERGWQWFACRSIGGTCFPSHGASVLLLSLSGNTSPPSSPCSQALRSISGEP